MYSLNSFRYIKIPMPIPKKVYIRRAAKSAFSNITNTTLAVVIQKSKSIK
jgi:hypothetical protein